MKHFNKNNRKSNKQKNTKNTWLIKLGSSNNRTKYTKVVIQGICLFYEMIKLSFNIYNLK